MAQLTHYAIVATALTLVACEPRGLTRAEMREALLESAAQGEAQGMESEIIELTTSFQIGQAVAAAREELRDFVQSQVPCSTVEIDADSVTIDFGTLEDDCTYRGHTYAGVVRVTLAQEGDSWIVDHGYDGLTNGDVTLDGTAHVTWTGATRHIVTELDFERDGDNLHVEADRTQAFSACEDVDAVCVTIDGTRVWTNARGTWDMQIEDVHIRGIDPVPEAGRYSVVTPEDKEAAMSFSRLDEDTIEVVIDGPRNDWVFHVTSSGSVEDAGES